MTRTEIVEQMARALYESMPWMSFKGGLAKWDETPDYYRAEMEIRAGVQLTTLEARGLVVVPRVATEAMLYEGYRVSDARAIWTAMLTAAQTKDSGHD